MIRLVFRGAAQAAALILVAVGALTMVLTPALAQDRRQNAAGAFDFYVLALSWSPSFCAASQERNPDRAPQQPQCGDRPFSFVVHGLWPQYEKGFPEYCQQPSPRLDRNIVSSMLDVMPSPRLVFHEWDRHGTCSGLSPRAYFDTVRKVRAAVKIPAEYLELTAPIMVSPAEVETAFVKANPGLTEGGIAVACDNKRLTEVRICVNRDLQFRSCDETDRRACRRDKLVMPPVRGG
jgi:ribonuclease T2